MYSFLGTAQDWGRTNPSRCLVKEVLVEISSADDSTVYWIKAMMEKTSIVMANTCTAGEKNSN